ncbi:hypothetical protein [Enterococcus canintestini]|uniref:YncE family protein n=1 Tax=Enterococcus canintestini TaxID=317010 RepID=UPI0028900943|nr:hypothetical protein [Enterococcus canintestini]MDT2740611.1 hypothetical protein [Enterococcus canintestini]
MTLKKWKILGISLLSGTLLFLFAISLTNSSQTDGVVLSFNSQKEQLEQNYPLFSSYTLLDTSKQSYPLPDLSNTKTLIMRSDKIGIAKDMDPQGIVLAENYILISAYSRSHQFNSVIYILDASSGDHIKTIVLDGTPHAGGLAYDPIHKNVWVCTHSRNNKAQVAAIALRTLKKYKLNQTHKPIDYAQIINLGDLKEASFLTYYKKNLFIGFFDKNSDGILTRYDIQENGKFDQDYGKTIHLRSGEKLSQPEKTYAIDRRIQGITFYQDKIILSRSYGSLNSKIMIYNYHDNDIDLDIDALRTIDAPAYLEQIFASDDRLYIIFESATSLYKIKKNITVVDRVLQWDLNRVFK